jgi:hypothetical protein
MSTDSDARAIWILMLGALILLLARIGTGTLPLQSSTPLTARIDRIAR